jgi:ribonuclease T2
MRQAFGFVLSFAFAWGFSSVSTVAQTTPAPPVATEQFDYYVMALSWAPGFCDLGGKETSSPECREGSGDGFVVHGLWPNNEFRPNPESCFRRDTGPIDLDDENGVYPNDRLAAYEYRKHGTCTGLSPADYFATVRSVRSRLKIPSMFEGTSEPLHMSPEEIEQAFMAANANLRPDNMAISCSNGELVDVRVCLARDLSSYAICRKVARHSCQRASIMVAPVR